MHRNTRAKFDELVSSIDWKSYLFLCFTHSSELALRLEMFCSLDLSLLDDLNVGAPFWRRNERFKGSMVKLEDRKS